jgi:GTP-binding protein HflX
LHGKLDLAKAKGLKKSEIKQLNRLLQQRIPMDKIVTIDLADSVAELSHTTGYPLSVVVNRRGQVVNITVGQPSDVNMPELRGVRVGPGRLCGHRIIHTHIVKKPTIAVAGVDTSIISMENLQVLARNRLDLLAQIEVDPGGTFSRSRGEHSKFADAVNIAHLMPGRDSEGKLWKLLPASTVRDAQEDDFEELMDSLEAEFRKQAPGLPVAEGEERAILVGLVIDGTDAFQIEDELDELAQLARSAGATVCERIMQTRKMPDPKYFLGAGKVQELALIVQEFGANLVIVDQELSANQQKTLEDVVGVKVIDRTELILDIFAQRAQTREGKLQVELAQLQYLYPRLVGKGLSLSRLGGGIATRGPGETKLEIDRRRIRDRINFLEKEADRIKTHRDTQRRHRTDENLPVVAIAGYTNAGKSTLLNALTKSNVNVENKLFATLDPTTRRTVLPDYSTVLLVDTVGFIKKLPTPLVAAFRATLEEVKVADVLLHVIDASHPNVMDHIASVYDVLSELDAIDRPIITVLNKAEMVRSEDLTWIIAQVPSPVIISASKRLGLGGLLSRIQEIIQEVCPQRQKHTA